MKFTSLDLMKAMGLNVGDRVKTNDGILELFMDNENRLRWKIIESKVFIVFKFLTFEYIYNIDYEILQRPKRVGELKCCDYVEDCSKCPVRVLCGDYSNEQDTFYEMLQGFVDLSGDFFDQEIYDLLKARLDKVVE